MQELTDQHFREATAQGLWVIHFWSPTCAPCRVINPILARLEHLHTPEVQFGTVNGKTELETALSQQVQGYPTVITFHGDQPLQVVYGAQPFIIYQELVEALRRRQVPS